MSKNRYMMGGVRGGKEDVEKGMKKMEKGMLGEGLWKMIGDMLGGEGEYCKIMDGEGGGRKCRLG